jgi:hypothetical protein
MGICGGGLRWGQVPLTVNLMGRSTPRQVCLTLTVPYYRRKVGRKAGRLAECTPRDKPRGTER